MDAPTGVFVNSSTWYDCVEHAVEQEMRPHKIIANKEFCVTLFQPIHMSHQGVTGSLEGWVESSSNIIDETIGYDTKNPTLNSPSAHATMLNSFWGLEGYSEGLSGGADDDLGMEGSVDDNLFTNRPGVVPAGYMAERGA